MPMSIEKTAWIIKLRLSAKFRPSKGFWKRNCLMASFSADLFSNMLNHPNRERFRIVKLKDSTPDLLFKLRIENFNRNSFLF